MKNKEEVDEFIAHYGIKGMKWGVRRSQAVLDRNAGRREEKKQRKQAAVSKPKKTSRKERRRERKAAYNAAMQKKATSLVDAALKDPSSLVKVRTMQGNHLVTGREFVNFVAAGGVFDVSSAEIYKVNRGK